MPCMIIGEVGRAMMAESALSEPWRVKFCQQDATRYESWKRMEFTKAQWCGLKKHAEERGLKFLSSPFFRRSYPMARDA